MGNFALKRWKLRQCLSPYMARWMPFRWEGRGCPACRGKDWINSACKRGCPNNFRIVPKLHITEGAHAAKVVYTKRFCASATEWLSADESHQVKQATHVTVGIDWLKVNAQPVYDYLVVAVVTGELKYRKDGTIIF